MAGKADGDRDDDHVAPGVGAVPLGSGRAGHQLQRVAQLHRDQSVHLRPGLFLGTLETGKNLAQIQVEGTGWETALKGREALGFL